MIDDRARFTKLTLFFLLCAGTTAKWRFPGQQNYPDEMCHQLGGNVFNSSLMIQHQIFAFAEITVDNRSVNTMNPAHQAGPSVGIQALKQHANRSGVLANAFN